MLLCSAYVIDFSLDKRLDPHLQSGIHAYCSSMDENRHYLLLTLTEIDDIEESRLTMRFA
jgi:hypothetical protein